MRVVCVGNTGSSLSVVQKSVGYTDDSIFHLTLGREYEVYAMALSLSGLDVLVCDDTGYPRMEPIELFALSSKQVPADWEFSFFPGEEFVVKAIWGYAAMINDETHYDNLLQLEPNALRIFYIEQERRGP